MASLTNSANKKLITRLSLIVFMLFLVLIFKPWMPVTQAATNLALGKTITCNNYMQTYVATNANDGNVTTYWEGATYPNTLTVDLGSSQAVTNVVVKLNPDAIWGTRTQTFSILGSTNNSTYTTLKASAAYTFNPGTGNTVSITFTSASIRYVRLNFTANTGSTGGQVAEFEVYNGAAPTPTPAGTVDLIVTDISWSPANPAVGTEVTFSATIKNQGTGTSPSGVIHGISFLVDGGQVNWSDNNTTALGPGASRTQTANYGPSAKATWTMTSGTHTVRAWVDDVNRMAESNESNNTFDKSMAVVTTPTPTSTPTATKTPTPTPTSSSLPTPTATITPTATKTPTATVLPTATPISGAINLAIGKATTASNSNSLYPPGNATDGNLTTYWESASLPATLTVDLGGQATFNSINIKLNPDAAWSTRTQTLSVLTSNDNNTYNTLVSSATYTFNPATGNTLTISFASTGARYVRLNFTGNSGAPGAQVAEFQIMGFLSDLTVTNITWSPASPIEGNAVNFTATVKNIGNTSSPNTAHAINFKIGGTVVASGSLTTSIASNGTANITASSTWAAVSGTNPVLATVDPSNTINEISESNNTYTKDCVVGQTPGADFIVNDISWSPSNPSSGASVSSFSVSVKNRGINSSASGAIQVRVKVDSGSYMTGSVTQSLAAGATVNIPVSGSWTATNGNHTVTADVNYGSTVVENNYTNNSGTKTMYVGRGANLPFTVIEAESGAVTTNGTRLAKNFKLADFAGEASGRSAVYLDANGEYCEFTLTSPANAFVLRHAVAENTTGTISVYANGVDVGNFTATSKFSYVYASPTTLSQLGYNNSPGGTAYWLYEDAQLLLGTVYPVGTKIKIQKDSGDVSWIYLDLLETENVAPAATNPDPTKYVQVSASKSIDTALTEFRGDTTKLGIFIPAGTWEITNKIFLYGRATQIIGAGPWHTKLTAPTGGSNNDVGFNISSAANGTTIKNLSAWGNYIYRTDGPGKFIDGNGMQNVTIDNVWIEHFICMYWGVGSSYNTFKNCRIKNTFADGINMTNGSSYNTITNCYARGTGDDSFALFSAVDAGGSYNVGNQYTYDTAVCARRAACFAVYGGSNNLYQNLYAADSLTYPGITISSLSFGYNTLGFGDQDCTFDGITLDRTGGDFWTSVGSDDHINEYQNFGAIWLFCGDRAFKNILVKNIDINDSVYFGLMFQTKSPENLAMSNVRIENVNINNAARYGIKLVVCAESGQGPCVGGASFTNVKINNAGVAAIYGQSGCPNFTVTKIGSGNNW